MKNQNRAAGTAYFLSGILLILSCCTLGIGTPAQDEYGNYVYDPPEESFDPADRPIAQEIYETADGTACYYRLMKPWNYDKPDNAARSYPMIVTLHGSGGSSAFYLVGGNDALMQQYPCFLVAPTAKSDWGGGDAWIRTEIEYLIDAYRIDEKCIYVAGFSMGGSGSYRFADCWYTEYGRITAAIVRCAGNSGSAVLNDALAEKTTVWYIIGSEDDANRVANAEDAYQFIKNYPAHGDAVETIYEDTRNSYERENKTLVLNHLQIFRKSLYFGMGHTTDFGDPEILPWLFRQHLDNR
ncbi:MAG: hypothetical protein JW874_08620 [Spirochaetales bacterium]|nr:hypothetical protein [Spirochaetales bacterium]